jgi:hypothetical protein
MHPDQKVKRDDPRQFHKGLQCFLLSIENKPGNRVELYLEEGDCADMTGAIRLATAVNPDVAVVACYAKRLDTEFRKSDGMWRCHILGQVQQVGRPCVID